MFPVLFSIGSFQFQTLWIFIIFAIFLFSLIVFLESEEKILPTDKVFDLVIISAVLGVIFGRIVEIALRLGEISFGQFFAISQFGGVNFWGTIFATLAALKLIGNQLKLDNIIKLADIVSLAFIPAVGIFYLGKLITINLSSVAIFGLIWFLAASAYFFKASKRIQFPGFYLLFGLFWVAASQIVFGIFQSSGGINRIFNLTISALVLTFSLISYYLKRKGNFFEGMEIFKGKASATIEKVKRLLTRQRKTLESQISSLKKDDPFLQEGREQSRESGEDAYEFEGHERITVIRENLKSALHQVKKALAAIGLGKYGKCERCGGEVEARRLKVLPQATLCFQCEREVEKKRIG